MRTSARRQFWRFSASGAALASVVIVGCRWAIGGTAADFTVDVGQASRTVDGYPANPSSTATETQIAGRRVVEFRSSEAQPDCDDAAGATSGSIIVAVTPVGTQFRHDEACAAASRVLTALVPALA